jgi:hypothetical protein
MSEPAEGPRPEQSPPSPLRDKQNRIVASPPSADGRCEACGSFDPIQFAGTWICAACCAARSACCAEREL